METRNEDDPALRPVDARMAAAHCSGPSCPATRYTRATEVGRSIYGQFDINPGAAESAGLTINSKLLSLATRFRRNDRGCRI